jgi:hypothetical protein
MLADRGSFWMLQHFSGVFLSLSDDMLQDFFLGIIGARFVVAPSRKAEGCQGGTVDIQKAQQEKRSFTAPRPRDSARPGAPASPNGPGGRSRPVVERARGSILVGEQDG